MVVKFYKIKLIKSSCIWNLFLEFYDLVNMNFVVIIKVI